MTDLLGWGRGQQHLLPDVVVAFVDGELSALAHDRAAAHLVQCPACADEAAAQRQARAAVRTATTPAVPAGLLAALRAIPEQADLPGGPDGLAVTDDGQFMAVQRPDRLGGAAGFGSRAPLGSSEPLGGSAVVLGGRAVVDAGRRAVQGARVAMSGLVLGALALVTQSAGAPALSARSEPSAPSPAPAADMSSVPPAVDVVGPVSAGTASPPRPAHDSHPDIGSSALTGDLRPGSGAAASRGHLVGPPGGLCPLLDATAADRSPGAAGH